MGVFSRFWGSITGVSKEGNSFFYTLRGNTVDLPYTNLFEIYRNIPQLRAVIDKKAELFSNVRFKIVNVSTGKEDEINTTHPLNTVLANPNSLQSWRAMLYMIQIYKSIAGVAFIYPGFGVARKAKWLSFIKNIDFADYRIQENSFNNTIQSQNIDELIDYITFNLNDGKTLTYNDPSELIMFKDSYSSYIKNASRITTLKVPINNCYKALIARGVLLDKKGGVGILSGNQKDGGTAVPMLPAEKAKLESRLNNYGLDGHKEPIIMTDVPMKWQSMVFPTSQIMAFEEVEEDFFTMCDQYGVARETFNGNATFANKEQADAMTYTNCILSEWSDFFALLNQSLNTAGEGIKIVEDFCHIGALATNTKKEIETQQAKSTMLLAEVEKGLILKSEYRALMGYAPQPGIDDSGKDPASTTDTPPIDETVDPADATNADVTEGEG